VRIQKGDHEALPRSCTIVRLGPHTCLIPKPD
jgi:hypothetical protein